MSAVNQVGTNIYIAYNKYVNRIKEEMESSVKNGGPIVWVIIILIILLIAAYAFYCTRRGFSFGWNISFTKGSLSQMGVKCVR